MVTVITYGTFDMFHIGHLNLLRRLKFLGNKLIVAVSTDEFNETKQKKSIISFEDRCEIVKSIKYVDEVIEENAWTQKYTDIVNLKVDIFGMGDDWVGKFDDLNTIAKVVYLPRTEGVSSTKIKDLVKNNALGSIPHSARPPIFQNRRGSIGSAGLQGSPLWTGQP